MNMSMKNETEINNALLEIQKQIDYLRSLMGDAKRKPVGELTFDEAPVLPNWAVPRGKG
jgi:hypothetical protein